MIDIFNKIFETIKQNHSCVIATIVACEGSVPRKIGAKMIVYADGSSDGTIGGGGLEKWVITDARGALKKNKSFLKTYFLDKKSGLQVCGGKVSIFFEVCAPEKKLIILGGGHIGLALSLLGKLLNFSVTMIDNRRDFANTRRFPHVDKVVCGVYGKVIKNVAADKNTCIVIVTHGHLFDEECLEAALKTQAGYIGMIGSKLKIKHIFGHLLKKGFKRSQLGRVHTPIGLAIGAQTPEEIAIAIAGELIQIKSEECKVKS